MSNYISKQTILDLVEDYERRSKTAKQMLDNPEVIGEQWHRVQGKYEAYRSFIGELLIIELCKVEPDSITELAAKALEEIKSGIEWNWETYVDIASDALDEMEEYKCAKALA